MLLTHKNSDGFIYSFFEWDVVDKEGKFKNDGDYMYVREIWVHEKYDGQQEIKQFISELHELVENKFIKWIYWLRDGKKIKRSHSRKLCLRRAGIMEE